MTGDVAMWVLRTLYFVLALAYAIGCFNVLLHVRAQPAYLLLIPLGAVPLWILHRRMLRRIRRERLSRQGRT